MTVQENLKLLGACCEAREWAGDKSLSEIWATCERGDWMMWWAKMADMCDLRTLTLIKARQAELAKPWMKDPLSLAALQAAFDFANGLISEEQLASAASASASSSAYASAAAASASASAASASSSASAYASAAAAAYAYDASAASASSSAAAAAAAYDASAADSAAQNARAEILRKCADICREVLPNPQIEGVE